MGLFRNKSDSKILPMLYPAGFEPMRSRENPGDVAHFNITPQQRSRMGIPAEDRESYIDAMYAHTLGLNEAETVLAWGPVHVGPPTANREFDGTAVVTEESLIVWWLPNKGGLIHVMHNRHDRIGQLQVEGPTAATLYWRDGIYADDAGKYTVENPNIYLAARVTHGKNDGHDNRRAFYLFYTFAHYVKQQGFK